MGGENIMNRNDMRHAAEDIEAVITSFNQGSMVLEAVRSLCGQTVPPARILIVDDGSTDEASLKILHDMKADADISVSVTVLRQPNKGVSAARNTGIRNTQAPMVLVLDGDDRLQPAYIEQVGNLLRRSPSMIAASSWMHTFGVLDAVIHPSGGDIAAFLSHNCCPASHILRREAWEKSGGYDESMRSGFEDWDFFLSMLEAVPGGQIGIVEAPLIDYRTAPASSNVKSMSKRLELMRFLIEKHIHSYREHIADAILDLEAISMSRLMGWENAILHSITEKQNLSEMSEDFLVNPTYGDGGMAAAVRIASIQNEGCRGNEK